MMVLAGLLSATGIAAPSAWPTVAIRAGDGGTLVYDYSKEHCAEWDTPDAPLRAFRDAQGQVTAFASDDHSRLFKGSSLLTIRHTCHSSFTSREDPDPGSYAGLGYITATWTDDGKTVTALIHNEYHAEHFPGKCLYDDSMKCWYTTIVSAQSRDGGQTFTTAKPPAVVAAAPYRQDFQQGRHRGFFNPSNIFFHDGFYYMATDTTGGIGQRPGLCLFRTATVDMPRSWRAYDGHGFTSYAIDPYREDTNPWVPCVPMDSNGTVGSISWHAASGSFLMVFQAVDDSRPNGYVGYAWSKDLIHWSRTEKLFDQPNMSSTDCADRYRYGYGSLADPTAPGRNFDSVGDHPFLFVTRFHVAKCGLPPDRDLIRLQVDIAHR